MKDATVPHVQRFGEVLDIGLPIVPEVEPQTGGNFAVQLALQYHGWPLFAPSSHDSAVHVSPGHTVESVTPSPHQVIIYG